MSPTPPEYLADTGIVGAPASFKWDNKLGLRFISKKDIPRLYAPIDMCSFKAKMALATALSEWSAWRLSNTVDIGDAAFRLGAAWASVVDPRYVKSLAFDLEDGLEPPAEALGIALSLLDDSFGRYAKGNIYLAEYSVNLAELARHLTPSKKQFDEWFSGTLQRLSEAYPRGAPYDESSGIYDSSSEEPVPREFFNPSYVHLPENARTALRAFLSSLDPATNPYLATADEMVAAGFEGTPYEL